MTVSFSDIKAMLEARRALPEPCGSACGQIFAQLQEMGVPLSQEWQYVIQRVAQFQNKPWPEIKHPRVAIYVSNYGDDVQKTKERLGQLAQQNDPLTRVCAAINADLRVYELDLSQQISDGITEEEAAHALSYGLMAVEEHVDCLIVDTLASGSGVVIQRWQELMLKETGSDPLALLLQAGAGHDVFAMLGAIFAARMANVPVFGGAKSGPVIQNALSQLLPNESDAFFVLPSTLPAPDALQAIHGLQQLQFLIALGPQAKISRTLINPKAA